MSTHTPLRLPDSMTRVDIGPYMRGLREHFALSQQDVSERLHIRHRYINAIENGAFDQMPGRAYAKGYVHTYAEFLGLDAEQAVDICFGPEPVRENHFVPEPMKRGSGRLPGQWRAVAVIGVIIGLGVLTIAQFTTGGDSAVNDTETVAEVPEEMLADMRRLLMPNASNHDCLQNETTLGCILDSTDWRVLAALTQPRIIYLADAAYGSALPAEEMDEGEEDIVVPPKTEPKPKPKPKPVPKPATKPVEKKEAKSPVKAEPEPAVKPAAPEKVETKPVAEEAEEE